MKKSLLEWTPQGINARRQWSDGETAGGNKTLAIITLGRSRRKKMDEVNIEHRVN